MFYSWWNCPLNVGKDRTILWGSIYLLVEGMYGVFIDVIAGYDDAFRQPRNIKPETRTIEIS